VNSEQFTLLDYSTSLFLTASPLITSFPNPFIIIFQLESLVPVAYRKNRQEVQDDGSCCDEKTCGPRNLGGEVSPPYSLIVANLVVMIIVWAPFSSTSTGTSFLEYTSIVANTYGNDKISVRQRTPSGIRRRA
jgi:hypothetical protein